MKTIYLLIETQAMFDDFEYRVIKAFTHKDKGKEIEDRLNKCVISNKAYINRKKGLSYEEHSKSLIDIKEALCRIEPDISDSDFFTFPYYRLDEVQLYD